MKFLTSNIGAKLLALLCAVFLWVYVAAGESKVGMFPGSLPIEARNTPAGLAAIYDEQKVKVKIKAPYEVWNKLGADNFKAYIDLAGLDEGTHEVDVNVTINLSNVMVVEKEPSKIIVRLEPIAKKEVSVLVTFEGEAKSGFVPGEPTVVPDMVEAKGARSLVEAISQAEAKIKLSGEDEDFKRTVFLAVYNEKGEKQTGIEFTPKSVEVEVPIVAASESKAVGVKVMTKGIPKSDYFVSKIETNPSVVEISGTESALKPILYVETKEVDIEGISNNLEKDIELVAPSGVTLKEKKVRVKITLALNTIDRQITASFNFKLNAGVAVTYIDSVKIVVSGPTNIISTLSSDQVIITFNLIGKGAGTYSGVNITKDMISLPEGCSATSWLPSAVTIVIE